MTSPDHRISRRSAIAVGVAGVTSLGMDTLAGEAVRDDAFTLRVDPVPLHALSPFLYMQFMEPLGATDGSVEAAWDHRTNRWRDDFVGVVKDLSPTMFRWGGIFADYYRWREGVGPRTRRPPMHNLLWGGIESNQVGTAEFVDLCNQVSAAPLMCVNFESDGRKRFMRSGDLIRTADAQEAAEWVAYCNAPSHALRREHGHSDPLRIGLWQLGNETSYDRRGFDLETAARKTEAYAKAMRKADPTIELIGWGDSGWAPRMWEIAGEHLQYLAFHHMFDPDDAKDPVLRDNKYRHDPDRTWNQLMGAVEIHERKIQEIRNQLPSDSIPLAMTECHFAIPGRDRCDVLSSWAAGVSYARMLNAHQRHGDLLQIATAADFCGNRWQVNAVMLSTPPGRGRCYLMPVAEVMRLYRHHSGDRFLRIVKHPDGLDVTASRTEDRLFLHVINLRRQQAVLADIDLGAFRAKSAKAYEISAAPEFEVTGFQSVRHLAPKEKSIDLTKRCEFPAASVTVIECDGERGSC